MSKRLWLYHRTALWFFALSLTTAILNDAVLRKIPTDIMGYIVFLSLGLYVGFHLCLDEVKRAAKHDTGHWEIGQSSFTTFSTGSVEVENCFVIQIDFKNGGYLDSDRIEPGGLDENGNASIEDDRGRSFNVHIEE